MLVKAIKIDVEKQDVYIVEVTAHKLQDIYNHLKCDTFAQIGRRLPNGDSLLVDDNGWILPPAKILGSFLFGSYPQPLSGNGLLMGCTDHGHTISVKSDLQYIRSLVTFMAVNHGTHSFKNHPLKK